ncbi:hypothetical protein F4820DRAFT_341911 [Hypoxylon rubiginosum]|uniref:Uncharacterized protein n=1 Tax=Hypoxylon rubiginosum TaxID=110542 RepID=A0ACB9ZE90_9PEZI|nr:hypothetical protein F4820DRAFT_341911 [Hypoxylon rubiginosum]
MIGVRSLNEVGNRSLKRRSTFYHVLDDHVFEKDVGRKRKITWNELGPSLTNSKKTAAYEEYLRAKWPCSDAMPEAFDPDKLEVIRRTWSESQDHNEIVKAYTEAAWAEEEKENHSVRRELLTKGSYFDHDDEGSVCDVYSQGNNPSCESISTGVSITESLLDSDELDGYDSEVTVGTASRASIISRRSVARVSLHSTRTPTPDAAETTSPFSVRSPSPVPVPAECPPECECQPRRRTGTGSKPPLSRSAFSTAGLPHPKNEYQGGRRRSETLTGYPRAPGYFPFQSGLRM